MRLAVFSDLHGNLFAARALLEAVSTHTPDAVVAAGDICLGGAHPAETVDLLMQAGVVGVFGNTETYLRSPHTLPPDEKHASKWHWIQPAVLWTLEQLTGPQRSWLAALPFELRFGPTARPEDDLLVVHANPRNVEDNILPPVDIQRQVLGQVQQPDDDPRLSALLDGVKASVIAFGHYHLPSQRVMGGLRLVNVAAASLPSIDHSRCARWSLFTWNEGGWDVQRFAVDYGIEQEIAALQACSNPSRGAFLHYFGE